jgi:prophage regulatory protein
VFARGLAEMQKLCELQARFIRKSDCTFAESKPPERLLRLPEVVRRTGLSKRTIYRLEGIGRLPSRRQLGLRAVGWLESEVEGWLRDPTRWRR